ncbi:MAG: efflux RND transporter periplasmic adaptor subunit [Candidatus Zixiibacteriota bacterium]
MIRIISVLITLSLLLISCGNNDTPPGGSGLIEADDVVISSEVAGKILAMNFDEGDMIGISDKICTIDTTTYKLRLDQTVALKSASETNIKMAKLNLQQVGINYSLAEKEFNRVKQLLPTGSANQQQYDKIENAYKQAEVGKLQAEAALEAARSDLAKVTAEIAILEESLDNCTPQAPISGRIIKKYISAGELIAPGKGIVKIASLDTVWVKVYLPPADLTKIKLGGTAQINPEDGRDSFLEGYISWISSEAEFTPKNIQTKEARADLVYAVKLIIPNENERLKIGMPVSVTIQ